MPILEKIVVSDFRNIQLQELEFSPNINCISGNNGEGKTNLLDAIYYLSMTKSAFGIQDKYNFRHGTEAFSIAGTYLMNSGLQSKFALQVGSKGEKKIKRDDKVYSKISEHIGVLPVVLVSPEDSSLVSDSGEERRRFVNSVLSQMDRNYMSCLQQYNRLLLQRNRILKEDYPDKDYLSVIDTRMSALSVPIYNKRKEFVEALSPVVSNYYRMLSSGSETVSINYVSQLENNSLEELLNHVF